MNFLLLTVRFLDDRYHGLLNRGGPPEWPPSPFRLFCALVAGVARRGELDGEIGTALSWLQKLEPPIIIAPKAKSGQAIIQYVPNNDGDKKTDRQERLTAKPTFPTLMLLNPDEKPRVHYLWDITGKSDVPVDRLRDAARSLTTLGWGVDMAFADARSVAEIEAQELTGIRWHPKLGVWRDEGMLRVPTSDAELQECTLCDLKHCHQTAIDRIEYGKPLHTVDKPRVFDRVFYASVERPISRPSIVFDLRQDDGERFSYPQHKLMHIAGMVRHLAIKAMTIAPPADVADDWVETYVAGHLRRGEPDEETKNKCLDDGCPSNSNEHRQFSYIPLPSIGHVHTDPSVRRVMIVAPLGDDRFLHHLARRLDGEQLQPTPQTNLDHPPTLVQTRNDTVASHYTRAAVNWASVTPVILPGHNDHKPAKTLKLIQKALAQSGIEQACEFEWSSHSRFPKSLSAHKYVVREGAKRPVGYLRPDHLLSQTAVHLTLRLMEKIPGPLAIGAGRHCGLGLFAAVSE
ncbi:MAG: type I-U CRISPR-associated protein Csb2 [Planctomycetaceae bacterium]